MKNSEVAEYFDRLSDQWNSNYCSSKHFRSRINVVSSLTSDLTPGSALDIGCGSGFLSLLLAKRGFQVSGLDISPGMVNAAKELFEHEGLQGDFRIGDAETLKSDQDVYDLVTCISVLEWVDDDIDMIRTMANSLRTGGHLLVSVPNRNSVPRRLEKTLFRIKERLGFKTLGYLSHQRRQYDSREFDQIMMQANLRVEKSCFFVSPAGWSTLAPKQWWGMLYCGRYIKV